MIPGDNINPYRKTIVCIDSYCKGVPQGRIFSPGAETTCFESLSQFLIQMEEILDEQQSPQAYTQTRHFGSMPEPLGQRIIPLQARKGTQATFELQVIFRQHTSWQGILFWQEAKLEQRFRSVLELVVLIDSALRRAEGSGIL